MIAAVRVRGDIDASQNVSRTLHDLKLRKKNQCVLLEERDAMMGMLAKAKDYIAYGDIDDETLEKLEERKGDDVGVGDVIDLAPPTKGFRDTRKQVGQGGSLGKRGDMDKMIARMV